MENMCSDLIVLADGVAVGNFRPCIRVRDCNRITKPRPTEFVFGWNLRGLALLGLKIVIPSKAVVNIHPLPPPWCQGCGLIPNVRQEKRDGSTSNNPYVAFRRRTEKMQTRKNRKNDEASYEKMLKLRRDLNRAVSVVIPYLSSPFPSQQNLKSTLKC